MTDKLISSTEGFKNHNYIERQKPNFWTEEEDKILKEKAKEFNYKNWNSIAKFIPGRTSIQCSARFRRIKPGSIKGASGKEEDSKLLSLYKKYGRNWAAISKEMPHRTGKQIRDRFLNNLDTKYDRGKFTKEEDNMILKYYKIYGNSWAKIAKKMKTRTGDMIKNRFYSSLKKEIINNNCLLKIKRKRNTSNFKIKSFCNNNEKEKTEKELNENYDNIIDRKDKIKDTNIFLNNSNKEDYKIVNQINKANNLNSTNIFSYDSNICNINSKKYIVENNIPITINEESEKNGLNKSINSYQSLNDFEDKENKIKENVNKIENNNNNNNLNIDLKENLFLNELINTFNFNYNYFNSKLLLELNRIDNVNNNIYLGQEADENIEKLKNSLNLN